MPPPRSSVARMKRPDGVSSASWLKSMSSVESNADVSPARAPALVADRAVPLDALERGSAVVEPLGHRQVGRPVALAVDAVDHLRAGRERADRGRVAPAARQLLAARHVVGEVGRRAHVVERAAHVERDQARARRAGQEVGGIDLELVAAPHLVRVGCGRARTSSTASGSGRPRGGRRRGAPRSSSPAAGSCTRTCRRPRCRRSRSGRPRDPRSRVRPPRRRRPGRTTRRRRCAGASGRR